MEWTFSFATTYSQTRIRQASDWGKPATDSVGPLTDLQPCAIDAAVARSVTELEAAVKPEAQKALRAEWDSLGSIGTRGESKVQACHGVVRKPNGELHISVDPLAIPCER
eukprot:2193647-Pyramimonas_sp.AAC.1